MGISVEIAGCTEYLNEKEKAMLVAMGKEYKKEYETELFIKDLDLHAFRKDNETLRNNILLSLYLRNYMTYTKSCCAIDFGKIASVLLTTKALNFFNSDAFEAWLAEEN